MLCVEERLTSAIKAMKEAHPYEEVTYIVWWIFDKINKNCYDILGLDWI